MRRTSMRRQPKRGPEQPAGPGHGRLNGGRRHHDHEAPPRLYQRRRWATTLSGQQRVGVLSDGKTHEFVPSRIKARDLGGLVDGVRGCASDEIRANRCGCRCTVAVAHCRKFRMLGCNCRLYH
jgi:hypothetical protein